MLPRFIQTRSFRPSFVLLAGACAVLAGLFVPATPAFAGLGVGASEPFDATRIRAVRSQENVASADNGTVTLFAWVDHRSGNSDIYAARVAHDGTVLDPNGIAVAATGADEDQVTVSWNGTNWLVAFVLQGSLLGARVSTSGEVLDPSGFLIAQGPFYLDSPAAAGLGTSHLIIWRDSDIAPRIVGALVDSDGNIEGGATISEAGPYNDVSPAVAVQGTTALCAFLSLRPLGGGEIHAFRFERSTVGPPTLVRLDASDLVVSPGGVGESAPAVASDGSGWLVAWSDARNANASGRDIWGARISAAGALLDASGIELSDDAGDEVAPAVTHTGSEWLVAWSQEDAGQFMRAVANNGNPAAQRIDVSTASGTLGRAAFGGDPATPIIAWSDPEVGTSAPTPPQDILGRRIAANLSLGAAFPISTQTPNQTQPVMSFAANRWFIAWVDDRFGPTEGRLRYALTDDEHLVAPDPGSIAYVAERPGLDQRDPTIAFDGNNFNLFWTEERGGHRRVVGARFTTGGVFIDSVTVAAEAWNHTEPAAIHHYDGKVTVAWTDSRVPADRDIWGRQLEDGALYGNELKLVGNVDVNDEKPKFAPRIVESEYGEAILAYQRSGAGDGGSIAVREVYSDPLFAYTFYEYLVRSEAGRVFESPQIAWNGAQYLVTYQELIANDGAGLYIPWCTWIKSSAFNFISFPLQLGPGSYVPANPISGSAGYNFVTLRSRLDGGQVNLDIRRANAIPDFPDDDPIPYTSDPEVDVPGFALQGPGDRVGLLHLRRQDDAEWSGLRLFGAEARDTLEGRVVLNEFLANPQLGEDEFYELFNVSGQRFQLEGWYITVDGNSAPVTFCQDEGLRTGKPGGDVMLGSICGVLENESYSANYNFDGLPFTDEGYLPNRGGVVELFTPSGVKVDEVAYGYKGGAPVSPAIPLDQAPAGRVDRTPLATTSGGGTLAPAGVDSVAISTGRLPNGSDSNSDANDFNMTTNSTPGEPNMGTAAQLGSKLFVARAFWNPTAGPDAVELFNPSLEEFDFSGWYLGSNDGTQRIGIPGNAWSVLRSLDKRSLRRDEPGSFTTDLDYLTVVYLLDENFVRVEQIGWSRPDGAQPELCLKREPDTGGFHNGYDWFTSGGEQNLFAGQLRYADCDISAPDGTIDAGSAGATLSFRGAVPNPMPSGRGALVFTVPGASGGPRAAVRLRLIDVAGRVRATLVDDALAPGEHRVALAPSAAGIYYAHLEIGGQVLSRPVVIVP